MLLALDTSTSQIGLALFDGTQLLAETTWTSRLRHTVELAPAVQQLLERVGINVKEVTALGVALGPGSFTSLRVGLAFAKGLALARHIPLVGIPTLDVTSASVPLQDLPLLTALQAGRGRLAVAWYAATPQGWQTQGEARGMTVDELSEAIKTPSLVCGELTAEERQRLARKYRNVHLLSPARCLRRPGHLAELAWERWQSGGEVSGAALAPIYLHVAGEPPPLP